MSLFRLDLNKFQMEFFVEAAIAAKNNNPANLKNLNQCERKILKKAIEAFQKNKSSVRTRRNNSGMTVYTILTKLNTASDVEPQNNSKIKRFFKQIGNIFHLRVGINSLHKSLDKIAPIAQGEHAEIFNKLKSQGVSEKVLSFEKIDRILGAGLTDEAIMARLREHDDLSVAFVHANVGDNEGENDQAVVGRMRFGIGVLCRAVEEHGENAVFETLKKSYYPCFDGNISAIRMAYFSKDEGITIFMPKLEYNASTQHRTVDLLGAYINSYIKDKLEQEGLPHDKDDDITDYRNTNADELADSLIKKEEFIAWCKENTYIGEKSSPINQIDGPYRLKEEDIEANFLWALGCFF